MEGQPGSQPTISRVPVDERIRTCRPAILRQTRTEHTADESRPTSEDWNIIRGED